MTVPVNENKQTTLSSLEWKIYFIEADIKKVCDKQKNQCNAEFHRYEACAKIICIQTLS